MRYSISDTAEYGDYMVGSRMVTEETKKEMKKVLEEIQDGSFAKKWIEENKAGRGNFLKMRKEAQESLLEKTGKELREKMTWKRENYEE